MALPVGFTTLEGVTWLQCGSTRSGAAQGDRPGSRNEVPGPAGGEDSKPERGGFCRLPPQHSPQRKGFNEGGASLSLWQLPVSLSGNRGTFIGWLLTTLHLLHIPPTHTHTHSSQKWTPQGKLSALESWHSKLQRSLGPRGSPGCPSRPHLMA